MTNQLTIQELAATLKPGETTTVPMTIKFRDRRNVWEQYIECSNAMMACDSMIDFSVIEDNTDLEAVEEQLELQNSMEGLCEELAMLEAIMSLRKFVDCDCFY